MPYIPDIEEVRGWLDPAPNWRWAVLMPSLPGPTGPLYMGLRPVLEMPFGMVEKIDFNLPQFDTDARSGMASRQNFPRFVTITNISISFYEDIQYTQTRYLRTWQNHVMDDIYDFGMPANYKWRIILFAFDYVSNTAPQMVGVLENCFPVNISGLTYAFDQSGRIVVNADFTLDEIFIT